MISELGGYESAASFSFALGRLDPADFEAAWNWPLRRLLIWNALRNVDIKNEGKREMMAKALSTNGFGI